MSYNLPPGNDNKGGTPFEDILPGIVTAVGLTLFFLSPLGGIFFAVTNTLFVLALVTPVLIYAGFQIWSKLNIIEGSCPSCNAPVVVLKSDEGQPSVCLSCGASVRATKDKKSVELCSGTSMDDIFFSNGMGSDNIGLMDMFTNEDDKAKKVEERQKRASRETTVIDVDVLDD